MSFKNVLLIFCAVALLLAGAIVSCAVPLPLTTIYIGASVFGVGALVAARGWMVGKTDTAFVGQSADEEACDSSESDVTARFVVALGEVFVGFVLMACGFVIASVGAARLIDERLE